jgi:hypothetical protein
MRCVLSFVICLFVLSCLPVCAAVSFSDSTFLVENWTQSVLIEGNGGTISVSHAVSDGNPGAFARIYIGLNGGATTGYTRAFGYFARAGAIYDPSTQGAISALAYEDNSKMVDTSLWGSNGQRGGMALLQNGNIYDTWLYGTQTATTWRVNSYTGLRASDFCQVNGPNGTYARNTESHPDFSVSGTPIQFGFLRGNTSGIGGVGTPYFSDAGIDNWSVMVTAVPEPSSLITLLGGAGVLLGARLRRRK